MIKVDELIYEFDLLVNKRGREDNISIPLGDKIVFLNQAQISWIKNKIGQNNVYRRGYESSRKRIDDLQVLKVNDFPLKVKKSKELSYQSFYSSLKDAPDYMFYVTSHSIAKKNECQDSIYNNLVREGELKTHYYDVNYNPSFEWRETLTTIGNDNIYVYTDGSFDILSIHLTYLRYPSKIDYEGYVKLDGTSSTTVDCELPEYAKQDIVDLAVKFATHAVENFPMAQAAENRIIKNNE